MSSLGTVRAGSTNSVAGPFVWDAVHGARFLIDVPEISAVLPHDFSSPWVTDMSDDGRVFVGYYGSEERSFRLVVPSGAFH